MFKVNRKIMRSNSRSLSVCGIKKKYQCLRTEFFKE